MVHLLANHTSGPRNGFSSMDETLSRVASCAILFEQLERWEGKGLTSAADSCCGRLPWSLAGGRLPKFYLVSFWIDDPAKLAVLGIVDPLENVAPFFT